MASFLRRELTFATAGMAKSYFAGKGNLLFMGESVGSINRVKNDVASFIRTVRNFSDRQDREVPQTVILTSNVFRDREYEHFVAKPSKLVRGAPVKKGFFRDTAAWLMDNDAGFDIPPGYDPDNRPRIQSYYQKRLFEFAQSVMDYTGTLHFSETDFVAAYNDLFTRRYSSVHDHRVVAPLSKFVLRVHDGGSRELTLPILEESIDWNSYEVSHLTNPKISRISGEEMAGLQTYGTPGMIVKKDQTQKRLGWAYKIEFNLRVTDRRSYHDADRRGLDPSWTASAASDVAAKQTKQILTAIRLFEPEKFVCLGPIYNLERSWRTHRDLCVDVSRSHYTDLTQRGNTVFRDRLDLYKEQFDDFRAYFEAYGNEFDSEGGGLSQALNRFNQMYRKTNRQDKIVDCFIGLETTLLRDGGDSTKIADRGTALLRHHPCFNTRYVHDLLSLLTRIRNGVVHNSARVEEYIDPKNVSTPQHVRPVENIEPRHLLKQARSILAHVIREYAYLMGKESKSVHEINVDLLDYRIRTSNLV